jgi:hypothetical protein
MKDYKCLKCNYEFKDLNMCPKCYSVRIKRLWCKNININGHGYKNNFEGNSKKN